MTSVLLISYALEHLVSTLRMEDVEMERFDRKMFSLHRQWHAAKKLWKISCLWENVQINLSSNNILSLNIQRFILEVLFAWKLSVSSTKQKVSKTNNYYDIAVNKNTCQHSLPPHCCIIHDDLMRGASIHCGAIIESFSEELEGGAHWSCVRKAH